ncbi:MAG: Asp-tRNA(Asn)/Glu-tRNA(Gln) amidotransferase GatCAB subunit A, partial [Usitatibacter sp.]
MTGPFESALSLASTVRAGETRAASVAESALARIAAANFSINAFTRVLGQRALDEARAIDTAVAAGREAGPLAG